MHENLLPREFLGGRLRRLHPRDLAAFRAYRAIPELARYQGWSPMSDAEAAAFINEMQAAPLFTPGQWVQLGIAEAESDTLVGDVGLYLGEDETAGEVGFTLQPASRGRGLASLAVRAALEVLFSASRVTRVAGITDDRNLASIKLLERVGFKHLESREVVFRGETCTERVYALVRAPRPANSPS